MHEKYGFFRVSQEEDGMRIDRWMQHGWPQISYNDLNRAIRNGDIRLGGRRVLANARVYPGEEVRVFLPWLSSYRADAPQKRSPRAAAWILHEDDAILVINKPQGIASQGGTGQKTSIDTLFPEAYLVHRLDRDTSGAMVLALTRSAAQDLSEQFRNKAVEKAYWALTHGVPEHERGVLMQPLSRTRTPTGARMVLGENAAETEYQVLGVSENREHSFLELYPRTGRMHQIRAHLSFMGTPIIGDTMYGDRFEERHPLALHCAWMRFSHPNTRDPFCVFAPLPQSFRGTAMDSGIS